MARFRWTDEKIELLKQYYPNTPWKELYEILGTKSKTSILTYASRYHLSRDIYNKCHLKQEELDFILNNYQVMTPTRMAEKLGRSSDFICRILKEHNLPTYRKLNAIHTEDEEQFRELYPKYTNKYLHEKYYPNLTPKELVTQAKRLGLKKNSEKGLKWYDKEVLLEKLEEVVRKLERTPLIAEFQLHGLPSEITFRRYFGSVTKAFELIGIKRENYQHLIMSDTLFYDKLNNVCLSKTEEIISNFLIDNNFKFQKEALYKEVIPKEECGEKRFDWKINDKYIEYFGLTGYKNYDMKTKCKLDLIHKYNVKCLALYPEDINNGSWQNKILQFLK